MGWSLGQLPTVIHMNPFLLCLLLSSSESQPNFVLLIRKCKHFPLNIVPKSLQHCPKLKIVIVPGLGQDLEALVKASLRCIAFFDARLLASIPGSYNMGMGGIILLSLVLLISRSSSYTRLLVSNSGFNRFVFSLASAQAMKLHCGITTSMIWSGQWWQRIISTFRRIMFLYHVDVLSSLGHTLSFRMKCVEIAAKSKSKRLCPLL